MKYEFQNEAGERRTIEAPMTSPPPERIRCLSGDKVNPHWREATCNDPADTLHTRVYGRVHTHVRWQHDSWKTGGSLGDKGNGNVRGVRVR